MIALIRQPLVHFLAIGLCMFLLYEPSSGDNVEPLASSKTIVVDEDALLRFMQFRSKEFDLPAFEAYLAGLEPKQLQSLIDDYVREEVLYREARAMRLDETDYVIRRRLVQKLEFIAEGVADETYRLTKEEVIQYFDANLQDYQEPPSITFTHVFIDQEKKGREAARQKAEAELVRLNSDQVPFSEAIMHGDRFPYHVNYVERVPDYVASHFGEQVEQQLFQLTPDNQHWYGPFESEYGFHLIMVSKLTAARTPLLNEFFDVVAQDAKRSHMRQRTDQAIQQTIAAYDVKLNYPAKR